MRIFSDLSKLSSFVAPGPDHTQSQSVDTDNITQQRSKEQKVQFTDKLHFVFSCRLITYQTVQSADGHAAIYGQVSHPQNII